MRTGQPIIGRPAWYDRNPIQILRNWVVNGQGPHSGTSRWNYTVPAGKKAMVEGLDSDICRATAATTAGLVEVYVYLTPAVGGAGRIVNSMLLTNNVGDRVGKSLGASLLLNPGDLLEAFTADGSTAGTVNYRATGKITEFDA